MFCGFLRSLHLCIRSSQALACQPAHNFAAQVLMRGTYVATRLRCKLEHLDPIGRIRCHPSGVRDAPRAVNVTGRYIAKRFSRLPSAEGELERHQGGTRLSRRFFLTSGFQVLKARLPLPGPVPSSPRQSPSVPVSPRQSSSVPSSPHQSSSVLVSPLESPSVLIRASFGPP